MPTKKNFLGGQQNYDPKNGEYEPSLVGKNGKVVKDADGDGIAHEGWDFDEETQNYTNKDGEVFSKGEYENKYKIGQSDETVLNNAIWDLERQGKEINADNVINAINDDFSGYIGTKEKEDAFREYADKKAKEKEEQRKAMLGNEEQIKKDANILLDNEYESTEDLNPWDRPDEIDEEYDAKVDEEMAKKKEQPTQPKPRLVDENIKLSGSKDDMFQQSVDRGIRKDYNKLIQKGLTEEQAIKFIADGYVSDDDLTFESKEYNDNQMKKYIGMVRKSLGFEDDKQSDPTSSDNLHALFKKGLTDDQVIDELRKAEVDMPNGDLQGLVESFAERYYPDQTAMGRILKKANSSKSKMNVTEPKSKWKANESMYDKQTNKDYWGDYDWEQSLRPEGWGKTDKGFGNFLKTEKLDKNKLYGLFDKAGLTGDKDSDYQKVNDIINGYETKYGFQMPDDAYESIHHASTLWGDEHTSEQAKAYRQSAAGKQRDAKVGEVSKKINELAKQYGMTIEDIKKLLK